MVTARPRRRYRLGRRAAAAEATRRHIVETTLSLHDEQGITRTSYRDVAARAGVSTATVLHHFPRMPELIDACGRLVDARHPMPGSDVLDGIAGTAERLRRVARAMFEWWAPMSAGWDHLQVDRRTIPEVDHWLRETEARHRRLVAAALRARARERSVSVATALTSFGAWRSMRDAGMTNATAAAAVARTLIGPREQESER